MVNMISMFAFVCFFPSLIVLLQMKEMLNLIEAYLDMVGHSAYRIDGSMGQVGAPGASESRGRQRLGAKRKPGCSQRPGLPLAVLLQCVPFHDVRP